MNKKEVKRAPVLRFKGFTNDWEQRKLKKLGFFYKGKGYTKKDLINNGVPILLYGELYTHYSEKISNTRLHSKLLLHSIFSAGNEVVLPDSGETSTDIARASWISNSGIILAGGLIIIKPNEYIFPGFLAYSLTYGKNHKLLASRAQGKSIVHIHANDLKTLNIIYPENLKEQQRIFALLEKLNKCIALQQRKNILLYKLRKSLLSTLLTDKCTPKVRFKSFLEPLKKQKLGDMAPLRGGFAFKANNYVNTGIPIIRISNILSNGSIGGNFAYYSEQSDDSNYILFNGSALIAMSGATTGKTAILDLEKKKKVYQNQRVGYFTPTKNSDYSFIKAIIKSNYFLKQLNSIMVAGAQPNVSAVDIDNFTFYFPESKKEQKYIGNNFEIINKIILLQKNRVDKLKKLKRSLLQQLFI